MWRVGAANKESVLVLHNRRPRLPATRPSWHRLSHTRRRDSPRDAPASNPVSVGARTQARTGASVAGGEGTPLGTPVVPPPAAPCTCAVLLLAGTALGRVRGVPGGWGSRGARREVAWQAGGRAAASTACRPGAGHRRATRGPSGVIAQGVGRIMATRAGLLTSAKSGLGD